MESGLPIDYHLILYPQPRILSMKPISTNRIKCRIFIQFTIRKWILFNHIAGIPAIKHYLAALKSFLYIKQERRCIPPLLHVSVVRFLRFLQRASHGSVPIISSEEGQAQSRRSPDRLRHNPPQASTARQTDKRMSTTNPQRAH